MCRLAVAEFFLRKDKRTERHLGKIVVAKEKPSVLFVLFLLNREEDDELSDKNDKVNLVMTAQFCNTSQKTRYAHSYCIVRQINYGLILFPGYKVHVKNILLRIHKPVDNHAVLIILSWIDASFSWITSPSSGRSKVSNGLVLPLLAARIYWYWSAWRKGAEIRMI